MTDYSKPATPTEVLERAAVDLRALAERHRQAAALESRLEQECREIAAYLDQEARTYKKWQPEEVPF